MSAREFVGDPTPEQLSRLPVWAQQYIERITRDRDKALETMGNLLDEQEPCPIYYRKYLNIRESEGRNYPKIYVPAREVTFEWAGARLDVRLSHGYHGSKDEIVVQYGGPDKSLDDVLFQPYSFQGFRLRGIDR